MSPSEPMTLEPFAGLVDDAAIFPPGNAELAAAVPAHQEHVRAWYAPMVGPFVCADTRLTDLGEHLDAFSAADPLPVIVTVRGGAGAVEPALTWVGREPRLRLSGVEVALRDEADLAHNAARMTTMLAMALPEDAIASVEPPRLYGAAAPAGWTAALDVLAEAGLAVKFRTGGTDADAFPSAAELATVINAALDRELPFKCTAGLHHAVHHVDAETGFTHHGFVNVLLATRVLLDGGTTDDAVEQLERDDPERLATAVHDLGAESVSRTRQWFRSFGSCSIIEPVQDLRALGLVSKTPKGAPQ